MLGRLEGGVGRCVAVRKAGGDCEWYCCAEEEEWEDVRVISARFVKDTGERGLLMVMFVV